MGGEGLMSVLISAAKTYLSFTPESNYTGLYAFRAASERGAAVCFFFFKKT